MNWTATDYRTEEKPGLVVLRVGHWFVEFCGRWALDPDGKWQDSQNKDWDGKCAVFGTAEEAIAAAEKAQPFPLEQEPRKENQ